MSEPAHELYDSDDAEGSRSYLSSREGYGRRPGLKVMQGGQSGGAEASNLETPDGSKSMNPDQLADKESGAVEPTKNKPDDLNYTGDSNKQYSRATKTGKKLTSFLLKRKKWLAVIGVSSGFFVLGGFILLFFLASLLKIPNLAQDITEYEFARMVRQFNQTADRSTEEALAVEAESANPTIRGQIVESYQNLRDNTWGRLDNYRPAVVAENLKVENGFKINTHNTVLGNSILDSVELDGTTYPVESVSGLARFTPLLKQVIQFKNDVSFTSDFEPALSDALLANDVSPIIRYFVANNIRKQLGIGLVAWTLGSLQGKSEAEADLQINRDSYNAVDDPNPESSVVSSISDAESQVASKTSQDVLSDSGLKQIIANGGYDPNTTAILNNAVSNDALSTVVGALNPAYQIAVPACIIYEGSLDESGPTINAQVQSQQRAYYFLASAADEEKAGGPTDPSGYAESTAVGAMNDKLGDVSQSNPYVEANGGTVNTSTSAISAEASATGQYTLLDATPGLGGSAVASTLKTLANGACPVLSNIWVGLGSGVALTLATLFADVFSAGGASAAEGASTAAVDAGVDTVVDSAASNFVERFVAAFTQRFGVNSVGDFMAKARALIKDTISSGGKLVGLTVLAKLLVMSQANSLYNGLEQGTDFANEADSGGNIQAGELERQQLFGRPLTCDEIQQSDQADQEYITYQNQSKSFTDRYFALSDANSLVSHVATAVYGDTNGSLLPIGNLANVISSGFGSIFGSLIGAAHAAVPCGQEDYSNVQFGWSQSEESLIDSSTSYQMLENQKVLDSSGQEDAIANQYAPCFGYQFNASGDGILDPTDPNGDLESDITGDGSIGTLLSNGDIVRDSSGNVIQDQGLCSPDNLGPNNSQFGDLVFRWRLAMSYDTTVDQLTNLGSTGSN